MSYRLLLLFIAILGLSYPSIAQTPKLEVPDWHLLQPANEEFKIETPRDLTKFGDNSADSSRKYYSAINGAYFYVFSDPVKKPENLKTVKRFVETMGRSLDEGKVSVPKTALSFLDTFGYWQHISVVRTNARIYIAQTVSKDENDPIASHFIGTFGLEPTAFIEPLKDEVLSAEQKPTAAASGSGKGSGLGNGSGSGQGIGSGIGSGIGNGSGTTPKPIVAGQTTPLRLVSKPKPPYTDFARFYEINGSVRVRVTFLASGSIGSVIAVQSLPFGLTDRAVAAAQGIKFDPPTRDGVPYTVTKLVEYTFTIY